MGHQRYGNFKRWGFLAALAIPVFETYLTAGILISVIAYALIGLGVGASGTSLLALLATLTAPRRRAAAATITWLMMIAGIAITAGVTGAMLDPYSHTLLLKIVSSVVVTAFVLTVIAIIGIEKQPPEIKETEIVSFTEGIQEIWEEPKLAPFFHIRILVHDCILHARINP